MRHKLLVLARLMFIATLGIAWFAPSSPAEASTSGLQMTVYDNYGYDNAPPLPMVSERPIVGTTTVGHINQNFDAEPPFGMYEDFIVKYEGYITSPITGNISFYPSADDGTQLYIDGALVDNNWYDKGCCGQPTEPLAFTEGSSKSLTLWFYENGGGAWVELYWDIGQGWELVPESAFTQDVVVPTTTTTTSTTTTTIVEETTTTVEETTTTIEETTTTEVPETWPPTTESTPPMTTPIIIAPEETVPATEPPVEETEPPSTEVSTPSSTPSTDLPTEETPEPSDAPTPSAPATEEPTESPSDTSQSTGDVASTDVVSTEPVTAPTANSTAPTAPESEETALPENPTAGELIEYLETVTSEDLQNLTDEEVSELIESIATADLTDEQAEQLAVALSAAPPEVKEAFEEAVNIFSGQFDSYIPLDSKVPVKTRRVLIVVTAATFILPTSSRKVK